MLIALTSLAFSQPALADDLIWDGDAGDFALSTDTNWNPDQVPANGDNLSFPAGLGAVSINVDLALTDITIEADNDSALTLADTGSHLGLRTGATGIDATGSASLTIEPNLDVTTSSEISLVNGGGSLVLTGTIASQGTTTFNAGSGDTITLEGDLTDSGGSDGSVEKTGAGTLVFDSTAKSYTGATTVSGGTLSVQVTDGIPADSAVSVASGAELVIENEDTIGSLSGAGTVTLNHDLLTFSGDNSSTTFSGQIQGSRDLVKDGSGTFTLSGNSPFDGDVYHGEGVLLLNGTLDTTYYSVDYSYADNGATLRLGAAERISDSAMIRLESTTSRLDLNGFDETVNGVGGEGGVITGSGTLYVNGDYVPGFDLWTSVVPMGNLYLKSGATIWQEIYGPAPGTDYDQTQVTGTLTLQNAVLSLAVFPYDPAQGTSFTIFTNDGTDPVNGKFVQGDTVQSGGMTFAIDYQGGDGNDVVLTRAPDTPTATAATLEGDHTFTANWNPAAGAASYRLDVSTNSSFTVLVPGYNDRDVGNVTTFQVTGLTSGTTYYYRVRGHNGVVAGDNSNTITTATTGVAPTPAPPGTLPETPQAASATGVRTSAFTANWSGVGNAEVYELQVACDVDFIDFDWGGFDAKSVGLVTSYRVTGLRADWTYYFRVRARNDLGTSSWSNIIQVRTSSDQQDDGGGGRRRWRAPAAYGGAGLGPQSHRRGRRPQPHLAPGHRGQLLSRVSGRLPHLPPAGGGPEQRNQLQRSQRPAGPSLLLLVAKPKRHRSERFLQLAGRLVLRGQPGPPRRLQRRWHQRSVVVGPNHRPAPDLVHGRRAGGLGEQSLPRPRSFLMAFDGHRRLQRRRHLGHLVAQPHHRPGGDLVRLGRTIRPQQHRCLVLPERADPR